MMADYNPFACWAGPIMIEIINNAGTEMNANQSLTPSNVDIKPRNREHDIAEALGRDWMGGDVFQTAWFNAMSITFPLGEGFFIDSVRHYADQIDDPVLKAELKNFCGQEGFHRREHQRYNEALCEARGYDLEAMEGPLRRRIKLVSSHLPPMQKLAGTAGVEHITAILAELLLSEENPLVDADPAVASLFRWHAAEEMEHKSVAFDVYRAVGGQEKMRRVALRRATFLLTLDILRGVVHMLRRDGHLWKPKVWWSGAVFLFGKQGVIRRARHSYMEYFREGFHPWQQDTRELLERWQLQDG